MPICDFELQDAASAFPLVFIRHNNSLQFCAVMGLEQGKNLFVDSSRSLGWEHYPVSYKGFPISGRAARRWSWRRSAVTVVS